MRNKIAIEEAFTLPELAGEAGRYAPPGKGDELARRLVDVAEERLRAMDEGGVEFAVLSLTSPGPQGRQDANEAQDLARRANDVLAEHVARRPNRFGGLASVSMHDAEVAAAELARAVTELGLLGAIVNDAQQDENGKALFFDGAAYDPFWEAAEELDVPVYLHPQVPFGSQAEAYAGHKWLTTATWGFAAGAALHTLRLCAGGVFDRFPRLKLILGHMGEHIPYDLWRIDHHLARQEGVPAKRSVRHYFRTNIWITTSGHFWTPTLLHAIEEVGAERILFAVDYPYESNSEAAAWFDNATLNEETRERIGRGNAVALLTLPA